MVNRPPRPALLRAPPGHTEVVRVVYDPAEISYAQLLKVFWESHDPTQCMRQGNDVGTQYRPAIYHHTGEPLAEECHQRYLHRNKTATAESAGRAWPVRWADLRRGVDLRR